MKYQRWNITERPEESYERLCQEGVPALVAAALCTRGVTSAAEARALLVSTEDQLHDPMTMKDMDLAVARISRALRNNEKIAIYGDYDVAVYRAVMEGRPLMERIVTVTGDAVANPGNFRVKIGTDYSEVLAAAGGFRTEPEKVICGGPMMGFAMFGLNVPVTKTATALLALSRDEVAAMEPGPCINCGRCVEVCPGRVVPSRLADYAEHGDEEAFLKNYGMECCECGCCSYVCPAKRQLTQEIKSMRKILLAKRKK